MKSVPNDALNERFYGELQGQNKQEAGMCSRRTGLHLRRSYDIQPPGGESLKDTYERTILISKKRSSPNLKTGKM
ncbi:MAG: histidine phosphatase family protein [Methanolobus sp.]